MSILSEDIAWMEPRTLKSRLRNVLMNSLIFKSCHIQEILRAKRRAQDDVPGELLLFLTVQILDDLALAREMIDQSIKMRIPARPEHSIEKTVTEIHEQKRRSSQSDASNSSPIGFFQQAAHEQSAIASEDLFIDTPMELLNIMYGYLGIG